jgi:hypothetical protein
MNSRIDIQRELEQQGSNLPADVRMPVFDLPPGYFENFPAALLAKVQETAAPDVPEELVGLSPLLAGISKQMPYSVPPDYFKEALAPRTSGEEDVVPGWGAGARNMPYSIPAGYFDDFADGILQQVAPPKAKVVSMFGRRWMQYAAAAVLAGVLVLSGIWYQNNKMLGPDAASDEWVAKKLQNVSNQELEAFIMSTEITGTETVRQAGNSKTEVRKMLKDVPSSELDAFLSQLPVSTEQIN